MDHQELSDIAVRLTNDICDQAGQPETSWEKRYKLMHPLAVAACNEAYKLGYDKRAELILQQEIAEGNKK